MADTRGCWRIAAITLEALASAAEQPAPARKAVEPYAWIRARVRDCARVLAAPVQRIAEQPGVVPLARPVPERRFVRSALRVQGPPAQVRSVQARRLVPLAREQGPRAAWLALPAQARQAAWRVLPAPQAATIAKAMPKPTSSRATPYLPGATEIAAAAAAATEQVPGCQRLPGPAAGFLAQAAGCLALSNSLLARCCRPTSASPLLLRCLIDSPVARTP